MIDSSFFGLLSPPPPPPPFSRLHIIAPHRGFSPQPHTNRRHHKTSGRPQRGANFAAHKASRFFGGNCLFFPRRIQKNFLIRVELGIKNAGANKIGFVSGTAVAKRKRVYFYRKKKKNTFFFLQPLREQTSSYLTRLQPIANPAEKRRPWVWWRRRGIFPANFFGVCL